MSALRLLVLAALTFEWCSFFISRDGMDDSHDDQAGETTYRGIVIMRCRPMLFRDGKKTSLVTCSFLIDGVPMGASSLAKARELIDQALGPA